MKKLFATIAFICVFCLGLHAQVAASLENDGLDVLKDTVLIDDFMLDDSTIVYQNIYTNVAVNQPASVDEAIGKRMERQSGEKVPIYRIRIYFSNAQGAREQSSAVAARCKSKFSYPVYRTFISPNFKVTVGNFRTKSDALRALMEIKKDFPSAFIVKEGVVVK